MLCITIIILITGMAIYFSGAIGLLILVTATAIGILPPLLQVKRSMAMGCLLLPVILFFLL
jgi:putative membrane protein